MGIEVNEPLAMAPLSGPSYSTEYRIPKGFNMGNGEALTLQHQLVSKFEKLHRRAKTYLDARGRAVIYGMDAFKLTMDRAKASIRITRDEIVELMVAVLNLGQEPLPPDETVDRDVANILDDVLLARAARALLNKSSTDCAESSRAAEARKAVAAELKSIDWTMKSSLVREKIALIETNVALRLKATAVKRVALPDGKYHNSAVKSMDPHAESSRAAEARKASGIKTTSNATRYAVPVMENSSTRKYQCSSVKSMDPPAESSRTAEPRKAAGIKITSDAIRYSVPVMENSSTRMNQESIGRHSNVCLFGKPVDETEKSSLRNPDFPGRDSKALFGKGKSALRNSPPPQTPSFIQELCSKMPSKGKHPIKVDSGKAFPDADSAASKSTVLAVEAPPGRIGTIRFRIKDASPTKPKSTIRFKIKDASPAKPKGTIRLKIQDVFPAKPNEDGEG